LSSSNNWGIVPSKSSSLSSSSTSKRRYFSVLWSWHWAHWICTPRKTREVAPARSAGVSLYLSSQFTAPFTALASSPSGRFCPEAVSSPRTSSSQGVFFSKCCRNQPRNEALSTSASRSWLPSRIRSQWLVQCSAYRGLASIASTAFALRSSAGLARKDSTSSALGITPRSASETRR
jgi:hypothetical protein